MRELSLNILDIVTNSIEADSTRIIVAIDELASQNLLRVRIKDNGKGMEQSFVDKVIDPFVTTRTTRSVGMGLSLFRQLALQSGGNLAVQSQVGVGTLVTTTFQLNNLDRPPIGDMADTIVNLAIGAIDVHFCYLHQTDAGTMCFDSFWLLARMAESEKAIYNYAVPAKTMIKEKLITIKSKLS